MPAFPNQKTKMETFIHFLYEGRKGRKLSKQEILPKVYDFKFAADEEIFFKELPEGSYDEESLIRELNRIIESRGRASAIGGLLEKREHIPEQWERAYKEMAKAA